VKPKEHIDKVWGKQRIRDGNTYRMMRYVLREDYNGRLLLCNIVTGQLVALDQHEANLIDNLPCKYNQSMESMVTDHFLVPMDYDEHLEVKKLRKILRQMDDAQKQTKIVHYTILPTTACNARCYYCFEQGIKPATMSQETAAEVVRFIDLHCDHDRFVRLSWFGGEPTIAAKRIDQICEGLDKKGIQYQSDITTNGYLFDKELVERAVDRWHLNKAMICVDGTEANYNETKAYLNTHDNPYQRVMRNIELLIEREVDINLRMNFDLENYLDFPELLREAIDRFKLSQHLQVKVHPVVGSYKNHHGVVAHASDEWFEEKIVELGDLSRRVGLMNQHSSEMPYLNFKGCQACDKSSVTITPQGYLLRCPEMLGDDQVTGSVWSGEKNEALVHSWKRIAEYEKCIACEMYPFCYKLEACPTKDRCTYHKELRLGVQRTMDIFYEQQQ